FRFIRLTSPDERLRERNSRFAKPKKHFGNSFRAVACGPIQCVGGRTPAARERNAMATPFIPRKDSLALPMMRAFAGGIAAAPGAYALSPSDAAAIGRAVDEFDAA